MEMIVSLEYSISELVINEGAHVNVWNFDNDLKSNKMNDGMLDSVLVQKHVQIEDLCSNIQ